MSKQDKNQNYHSKQATTTVLSSSIPHAFKRKAAQLIQALRYMHKTIMRHAKGREALSQTQYSTASHALYKKRFADCATTDIPIRNRHIV